MLRRLTCYLPFVVLALVWFAARPTLAQPTSENNERLRQALQRFPDADANKDGILTAEEARQYMQSRRAGGGPGRGAGQAPAPTHEDAAYGPHERNVLDFWKAESVTPTPLVIFIHGGGFVSGDKAGARNDPKVRICLDAGVSFAAINYRFREHAPLQDILRDAGRAVQFLRSKADEWNIDKARIASFGGSAGAGTSLWLGAHDDVADPNSEDPICRESSRLTAVGMMNGQATYDLTKWETFLGPFKPEFMTSPTEIVDMYHFTSEADFETDEGKKVLHDCDMLSWISADDAPVFMSCNVPPGAAMNRGQYVHHPGHVLEVKKACEAVGLECKAVLQEDLEKGVSGDIELLRFLLSHLNVEMPERPQPPARTPRGPRR